MGDIFEETEETLRAEQWMKIARRTLPWVIGVLAAALLGAFAVWGWNAWQKHVTEQASEYYSQAYDAMSKGDTVMAKTKFGQASKAGSPAFAAMAQMHLAGLAVDDGKIPEAIKAFDLAAKSKDPTVSDTAALKAAWLSMDTATYADMEKRLLPLTKAGHPGEYLAKEALAMAKLQAGDIKGARAMLASLQITLGAPEGVRARAEGIINAIDTGAAETARQIAKAPPAALPPAMPISPQAAQ